MTLKGLQLRGAGWRARTTAALLAGILIPGLGACAAPAEAPGAAWVDALAGGWSPVPYGSGGSLEATPDGLALGPGYPLSGVAFEAVPQVPYELVAVARRDQGDDFFAGLTFPVEGGHLTLVLGGWGGATCGLSCLDGLDAASNETTRHLWHPPGQWVEVRLRVERDHLHIDLDGERAWNLSLEGRACALRTEVLASAPFSWSTFATGATLSRLAWRPLEERRRARDLAVSAGSRAAKTGEALEAAALSSRSMP